MDERLAAINERVAAAADAWLADPRDGNVYQRLVAAIESRRAYLQPPIPAVDPPVPTPRETQSDEVLDELDNGTLRPLDELIAGDPKAAMERLRSE